MPRTIVLLRAEPPHTAANSVVDAVGWNTAVLRPTDDWAAWIRANRPAAVALDFPPCDCHPFAICRQLKLWRETNRIPVVYLAYAAAPRFPNHGLFIAADAILEKPISQRQAAETLNDLAMRFEAEGRAGVRQEVVFHVSSDTAYLEDLIHLLMPLVQACDLPPAEIDNVRTVIRELGTNAIEWGHRRNIDLWVQVTFRLERERLTIVIRDEGPGFDPHNLPHAAKAEDPVAHLDLRTSMGLREGGFGIMIARGLADELSYNETGNEARLVKRLSRAAPD